MIRDLGLSSLYEQQARAMYDRAAAQQGRGGLGGMLGQQQAGIGIADWYGDSIPESKPKPKTIKDELQFEVDEWLKDTI
jgi:hypothetical protein